ncbi:hypothetical protein ACOME3_001289 [Neoechinorhynchus agilis]
MQLVSSIYLLGNLYWLIKSCHVSVSFGTNLLIDCYAIGSNDNTIVEEILATKDRPDIINVEIVNWRALDMIEYNVSELYLANNPMVHIDIDSNTLKNLTTLSMSKRQRLPDILDKLSHLPSLYNLNLKNSSMFHVPSGNAITDRQVTILSLAYNNILSIKDTDLQNWTSLTFLSMRFNNIKYVSQDAFQNMTKLSFLDLSYNRIRSFQRGIFAGIPNMSIILLDNVKSSYQIDFRNVDNFAGFTLKSIGRSALGLLLIRDTHLKTVIKFKGSTQYSMGNETELTYFLRLKQL